MKKILRFGVIVLCVIIFSSLLFIAVKQTDRSNKEPKAPISVGFMAIARSTDPTSILVELPENHHADEIVLYFGDELGKFEPCIARFEVTEISMVCNMPKDLVLPENATVIWVYTANEYGISEKGQPLSLLHAPVPSLAEDESEERVKSVERYAIIAIAAALVISFLGYALLGKKTPDENSKITEENQ